MTPWTGAHQAPLSMGFSRQEFWSRVAISSPGDLPDPGIEPVSPVSPTWQANSLPLSLWEILKSVYKMRRVDWFPLTCRITLVQADTGCPAGFILTQDPTPCRISSGHRQNGLAIPTEFLHLSGRCSDCHLLLKATCCCCCCC